MTETRLMGTATTSRGRIFVPTLVAAVGLVLAPPLFPALTESPAGGQEASDNPVLVEGDVEKPRRISSAAPSYTEEARKARVQGRVVLETVIDTAGDVVEVKVVAEEFRSGEGESSAGLGLTESAINAVRSWKFTPATLDGEPVAVYYHLTINFRLDKEKKEGQEEPQDAR